MKNINESEHRSTSSEENDDVKRQLKGMGLFTIIVGDLLGFTGAGIGLGYLAWSKWKAPWWVLLFTSLSGLCLAFYRLYQLSKKDL